MAGAFVTEDSLVQCIAEIRRALGPTAREHVVTATKRGYWLRAEPIDIPQAPEVLTRDSGWNDESRASFLQEIRFAASADGTRIAFAVAGQGPVAIRAPHWMTHLDWDWRSRVFGPGLNSLASEFQLTRYDARGTGLSDRDADPGGLDQWVDDLDAVVEAVAPPRFALVAFSGGALVAIRYAALRPERVSALVLLGGMARGAPHRGVPEVHVEAFAQLIRDGWARDNPAFRQLMTTLLWPGAKTTEIVAFNELQRMSSNERTAAALLRRTADITVESDLPRVRVPCLVIHCANDALIPFAEAQLIASRIAGARLVSFDSPNHTPLEGEPAFAEVQRVMKAFIHSHGAVVGEATPGRGTAH